MTNKHLIKKAIKEEWEEDFIDYLIFNVKGSSFKIHNLDLYLRTFIKEDIEKLQIRIQVRAKKGTILIRRLDSNGN